MLLVSHDLGFRENISANFALKSLIVIAPRPVRRDVIGVTQLAAERFVTLAAVEHFCATLEMKF